MTQQLKFNQPQIASEELGHTLASDPSESRALAEKNAAEAMSDLGVLALADGDVQQAVARFQQSLRLAPTAQAGFHNLMAALLDANQLRGANFDALRSHLLEHWEDLVWRDAYVPLLVQPKFLNLEFVSGKCNLKCRMCIGVNAASHPNKLSYIDVDEIAAMLTTAPTITGLTLSSGDSDPLLHPQFADVLNIAAQHGVRVDLYTNGLPLSAKTARLIATGGAVSMINLSIDAATADAYHRIRGGDFEKVIRNLGMIAEMRAKAAAQHPLISTSFVAMRDNVHELPDFVRLVQRLGAEQVIVDDLSGWRDTGNGNEPATATNGCAGYLRQAEAIARELGLRITLHERLRRVLDDAIRQGDNTAEKQRDGTGLNRINLADESDSQGGGIATHLHSVVRYLQRADSVANALVNQNGKLACCGWIDGVWVGGDGDLHPCCMVRSPIDMGQIKDGPLLENEKYLHVKRDLLAGKVFRACTEQRMCSYVQQQIADNQTFEFIDDAEMLEPSATRHQSAADDSVLALPVLR